MFYSNNELSKITLSFYSEISLSLPPAETCYRSSNNLTSIMDYCTMEGFIETESDQNGNDQEKILNGQRSALDRILEALNTTEKDNVRRNEDWKYTLSRKGRMSTIYPAKAEV